MKGKKIMRKKKIISIIMIMSLILSFVISVYAEENNNSFQSEKELLTGNFENDTYIWNFGKSDIVSDESVVYTDSNDYADLTLSLGTGDCLNENIQFSAASVRETNTSGQSSLDDTKRYLIVKPKYDGILKINISFMNGNNNRIYYSDMGTDTEEPNLSDYTKESPSNRLIAGDTIKTNSEEQRTIKMTAGHSYIIYTYQQGSIISELSYQCEDDYNPNIPEDSEYSYNFSFGGKKDGFIKVNSDTAYGEQANGLTYGFIGISGSENKGTNGMLDGFCFESDKTVTNLKSGVYENNSYIETDYSSYDNDFVKKLADGYLPVRFSVNLEEHRYYRVRATIINTSSSEDTKASLTSEKRHYIMFEENLKPGEVVTKTFNVNLESVYANGKLNSDSILNVCAIGKNVGIVSVEIDKLKDFGQTIWFLGDSTVCDQKTTVPYYPLQTYCGIGQFMPIYINSQIAVSNQAEGGLKAWDEKHYNNAIEHMRKGDYLYVQYGINDKNYYNDTDKFKKELEKYYTSAHEKEVKLIIASTIDHHDTALNWNDDDKEWQSSMADYCNAAKEFVDDKIQNGADDIAFIDINTPYIEFMNNASEDVMQKRKLLGFNDENISPLAINYYYTSGWSIGIDRTHTNDLGADNAAYIAVSQAKKLAATDKNILKIDVDYDEYGIMQSTAINTIKESEYVKPHNTELKKTFYWNSLESMQPYEPANSTVQANVIAGLLNNAEDKIPHTVTDDVISKGWVPNSAFPNFNGESDYEYPLLIENVETENGKITSIKVKVQGTIGNYAQGVAEIYNADNEKKATLYTTEHIDNTAATFGNEYTLEFDVSDSENQLLDGYTYKIYMEAKNSDEKTKYSDEYIDAYMRSIVLKYAEGCEDKGTLSGSGNYPANSSVVISAETTATGYVFGGWYNEDGTLYSKEENVSISKLTENLVLTAKFVKPAMIVAIADFEDSDTLLTAKAGTITGSANIDTTRGGELFGNMAKVHSGNNLIMTLDETTEGNITAEFDAYYMSNEKDKYSYIKLKDENENNLIDIKFSRYTASGCYIKIGDETVLSGNDAWTFIRDGIVNNISVGGSTGINTDYVGSKEEIKTPLETTAHITCGVDTISGTAYIEFRSNTTKERYSVISGNIGTEHNVKSLELSADFSESKAMWVDNIKVTKE